MVRYRALSIQFAQDRVSRRHRTLAAYERSLTHEMAQMRIAAEIEATTSRLKGREDA
jgi:hypothetical protein